MLQAPSPHKGELEESAQGQGLGCVPAQAGTQVKQLTYPLCLPQAIC